MYSGQPYPFVSLYPPILPASSPRRRHSHNASFSSGKGLATPMLRDESPSPSPITTSGDRFTPRMSNGANGNNSSPSASPIVGSGRLPAGHDGKQRNARAGPGPSSASHRPQSRRSASQTFREWDHSHNLAAELHSPPPPETGRHRGLLIVAERDLPRTPSPPPTAASHSSRIVHPHTASSSSATLNETDNMYFQRFAPGMVYAGEVTLSGYALFAVDKWVTARERLVKTVVAVSSEDTHHLSTYSLVPRDALSEEEAAAEVGEAVAGLRKDGARPIETPQGTLMVTSLPSLRQDLQTIFIPHGDYRLIKPGLFVNINLKRFGCGGRSSLSLETPSAAIETKFLSLYRLPLPSSRPSFAQSVLEYVKLGQTALHICGLYGLEGSEEEQDGLLCERMGEGIKRWEAAFGRLVENETGAVGALGSGQYESVAVIPTTYLTAYGPACFAALFSLVTSMRYKLMSLNVDKIPRDPFTKVRAFKNTLLNYQRAQATRPNQQTEHLTPSLSEQINQDYQREKQQDATKITRLIKNQVSQAGAGLASNLGALHLGGHHRYDDSGESVGSESDLRASRHRGPSADGRGSNASGVSAPPDAITVSIQCLANTATSTSRDKDGIVIGRLRAVYTGSVTPYYPTPRDWQSILPAQSRKRLDPDLRELDIVDEELTPERAHHHHRLRVPERKGAIKNMTSRTGNALRDVTGWARRGSIFAETSDSDTTPHSAAVSSEGRGPGVRRMLPSLSQPHEPIQEESGYGSESHVHPSRSRTLPIPNDSLRGGVSSQRRSATFNITAPSDQDSSRPTLLSRANTRSYAGSESYAGGMSDSASIGGGGFDDDRRRRGSEVDLRPLLSERLSQMPDKRRRPLYRMVSAECLAEADENGVEFLHDGHGCEAWDRQQKQKVAEHGILRRRSFSHVTEHRMLSFVPPEYLAIDVAYCGLIDEMRHQVQEVSKRASSLKALETALQDHFSALVVEIRAREARIKQLAVRTEPLLLEMSITTVGTASIGLSNSGSGVVTTPSATLSPNGQANGYALPLTPSASNANTSEQKPAQARRAKQQLDLMNDKLSYSMKELDRHVGGAIKLGDDVDGFVRSFLGGVRGANGHREGDGAVVGIASEDADGTSADGEAGMPGGMRQGAAVQAKGMWPLTLFRRD